MNATIEELEREQEKLRAVMEANAARIAELRQARSEFLERLRLIRCHIMAMAPLKLRYLTLVIRADRESDGSQSLRLAVEIERSVAQQPFIAGIGTEEIPQVIRWLQRVQEIAEGKP
jgi:hypothetical protein